EALEKSDAKRGKWDEVVRKTVAEAQAAEGTFKAQLLVSAADTAYRFGRPELARFKDKSAKRKRAELIEQILVTLKDALALDAKNRRAAMLLERVYREEGRLDDLAKALEQFATDATAKEEKTAGFVRLARVFKKMKAPERVAAAYERVIDLQPGNAEATSWLVDFFTEKEMWDHLV